MTPKEAGSLLYYSKFESGIPREQLREASYVLLAVKRRNAAQRTRSNASIIKKATKAAAKVTITAKEFNAYNRAVYGKKPKKAAAIDLKPVQKKKVVKAAKKAAPKGKKVKVAKKVETALNSKKTH